MQRVVSIVIVGSVLAAGGSGSTVRAQTLHRSWSDGAAGVSCDHAQRRAGASVGAGYIPQRFRQLASNSGALKGHSVLRRNGPDGWSNQSLSPTTFLIADYNVCQ